MSRVPSFPAHLAPLARYLVASASDESTLMVVMVLQKHPETQSVLMTFTRPEIQHAPKKDTVEGRYENLMYPLKAYFERRTAPDTNFGDMTFMAQLSSIWYVMICVVLPSLHVFMKYELLSVFCSIAVCSWDFLVCKFIYFYMYTMHFWHVQGVVLRMFVSFHLSRDP